MRRPVAEWLILPLFLLPFVAGIGLLAYARQAYRAEIEPYRTDGARMASEWLGDRDRAAWILESYLRDFAPGGLHRESLGDPLPFEDPWGGGTVYVSRLVLGREPWRFSAEFPKGLSAGALADPAVRIEVEKGRAPADLTGVDEATSVLRGLSRSPDLSLLRVAPLPAATKLFLVRRWRRDDLESPLLHQAEQVLAAVRDLHRGLNERGAPPSPGIHRFGRTRVLASGGLWPPLVLVNTESMADYVHGAGNRTPVRLSFRLSPVARDGPATLFAGRVEEPLAGEFSFLQNHGGRWWKYRPFLRWAGPLGSGLLAFLLIPSALLVTIRRRRRLDEARSRFINELAHDLRTPLTSLRLYAEMLASEKAPEAERGRYVAVLARESARLTSLLGNLLDLSRLEHGRQVFDSVRIELDELVGAAIRDFAALYPDRSEDVGVSGPEGGFVTADRTAVTRCLGNLLDNAGKYTPAGTAVRVSWEGADRSTVRIVVADHGPGIPKDERGGLFTLYRRGRRAQADGVPGTGLGLALVRELAEGMGGSARLVPSESGAAFELRLPGGIDG